MPDKFSITAGFSKGSNWVFELGKKVFVTQEGDLVDIVDVVPESVYPEAWLFGGYVRVGTGRAVQKIWWRVDGTNVNRVRVDSSTHGTKSFSFRSGPGLAGLNLISPVENTRMNGINRPIPFTYGSFYRTVSGAVVRPVHEYWVDTELFGVMCHIDGMPHGTDRAFAIKGAPGANGRSIGGMAWSLAYVGSRLLPQDPRPDLIVVARVDSGAVSSSADAPRAVFKLQSRMRYACKVPMADGSPRKVEIKYWMSSTTATGWVGRVDVGEKATASIMLSNDGVPFRFTDNAARPLAADEIERYTVNQKVNPDPVDESPPGRKQLTFDIGKFDIDIVVGDKYQMRNGQKVKISVGYPDKTYYGWAKGAKLALKFNEHGTCIATGSSVRDLAPGTHLEYDIISTWKDRESVSDYRPRQRQGRSHKVYRPTVYTPYKPKETNPSLSEISDDVQFELPKVV